MTRYSRYIKVFSIISDLVLLNILFVAVFYYKFHAFHDPFTFMVFYVNLAWIFLIVMIKPYDISRTSTLFNILRSSYSVIISHILLVFAYYVFLQSYRYSRELLALFYLSLTISTLLLKTCYFYVIKWAREKGFNYRNIVVVNQSENPIDLQTFLQSHPEYGYHIKQVFDADKYDKGQLHAELKQYCLNNEIHEVFYSMSVMENNSLVDLMNFAEDNFIKIRLVADFKGVTFTEMELEKFGHVPVLKLLTTPLDDWDKQLLKRCFDIIFSLLVIILIMSWLLPILAILIRLDSKGGVFFMQQRTGRDNRPFWCYKLRTMYRNDDSDVLQATKNDKRITRIGKFLRNSSLDELPQFFNVLIGNMSVVGPRPHMLKHTQDFSEELDKFMGRHQIRPGITGLAQSKGYRGETNEFEKVKNRVKLDLFYVKYWSFFLDLKIIFATLLSMRKFNS